MVRRTVLGDSGDYGRLPLGRIGFATVIGSEKDVVPRLEVASPVVTSMMTVVRFPAPRGLLW